MKILKTIGTPISVVLTAGATYVIVTRVSHDYSEFRTSFLSYPVWSIVGCSGIFLAVVFLETGLWHWSLREMIGERPFMRWGQSMLVFSASNLAKYVPGRIWLFFLQSSMLMQRGVPLKTTATLNIVLAAYGALSALLVGCLSILGLPLALWIKGVAVFGAFGVLLMPFTLSRFLPRNWAALARVEQPHYWLKITAFSLTWTLHGCGAILLLHACSAGGRVQDIQIVGAMAFSWLVGALALFTPAGLGVREAALYLTMSQIPEGLRLSLPVVTRICLMIAEGMFLVMALIWSAISHVRRER